ncbi:carboxylesterase/lipase family protein [Herbiconiux sp. CPCC 203407]|uniref:Carboxylic ester hydrolase n=1 Tax=Herbiconiux oxytropis TaxID=2970915 RepID=A0AA42BVZ1_9MICO|nr:carboxylesterase/lipase family protein [Herbiconiux oxytropis]MCS5722384.1 carboxylesterase/lipase family protein [Herbiconiux oxytropis]MCS5727219.1 carboxylesterase/lipase family protein [Herbiconiux oxytropis]
MPSVSGDGLEVGVTGGVVRGAARRGFRWWRGIPFAAPPVGSLRFRAPAPVQPWRGVREATAFGPVAMQSRNGNFIGTSRSTPMSEDCLTVNVLRADAPGEKLPVMVFIHGGAYSVGSSAEHPRNGEALVREGGVVFVSFNYRLGALGYLDLTRYSTPERPIESNLGLRDQVAALEWVHDNIASFGGDPGNVTLFGESAGGNAVTTLMATPSAHGLFARAIAQSSPANAIYLPEMAAVWAEEFAELLMESIDTDGVESTSDDSAGRLLVDASAGELVDAAVTLTLATPDAHPGTIVLSPVIDGDVLPERPLDAFKEGRAARVPLIIGTNDREGSLFTGRLDILATTPKRIRAIFARTKKKSRKAIKAEYPGLPAQRAAADFGGDYAFWYPTVKVAERHSRFAPVHFYRFDIAPRLVRLAGFDATHGLDLFAIFDRLDGPFGRLMTILGGRRAFKGAARRMRAHWLSFARDGRVDATAWPAYDETERLTLIIAPIDRVEADPRGSRRLAWQAFVPHV